MHFFMELFLAAPDSGLPSALTALPSQASCLHFFTKLVLAAPDSGLPSALTALLSQDCAVAVLTAKAVITTARIIRLIVVSSFYRTLASVADVNIEPMCSQVAGRRLRQDQRVHRMSSV